MIQIVYSLCILALLLASCSKLGPSAPAGEDVLDGPLENLTASELAQHIRGDEAFNDEIFTEQTGLGPLFVATSCGSCHPGDGKGHPFTTLTRFGQADSTGNTYLDQGGPQLQNRALPGYEPELIPLGATSSRITPPAVTGLGFLELVSDSAILAMALENLSNPDGVRGRPNWISLPSYVQPRLNAISQNGKYIGRFGKKASVYNLFQQTANAYNQDMGITSIPEPVDPYSMLPTSAEVELSTIQDVVFYLQTLKAPNRRNADDAEVQYGEELFISTGCESCHRQTLYSGYSAVAALSFQEIHPYTDLLLHDMGSLLDDGYAEGSSQSNEWRTAPLWGLGLSPDSQGGEYFLLHDGRAKSMDEAIQFHGGEAEVSRQRYAGLNKTDKAALLKFLESL